jgi:hypothetical protein
LKAPDYEKDAEGALGCHNNLLETSVIFCSELTAKVAGLVAVQGTVKVASNRDANGSTGNNAQCPFDSIGSNM